MKAPRSLLAALPVALLLCGCAVGSGGTVATVPAAIVSTPAGSVVATTPPARVLPRQVPHLGPQTLASLPARTRQVVVVRATKSAAATSTVTEWQRAGRRWRRHGPVLRAHNGYAGWSAHHLEGSGTSPEGTFTLTAAGGRLPDPGARLPYSQDASYYDIGGTFMGHSLAGAFDYVVAIDYNRVPGSPPSDGREPLGADRGDGIWLHVDHGSPTHGCVSLLRRRMRALVRWLDPAAHPAIAMGTRAFLSR